MTKFLFIRHGLTDLTGKRLLGRLKGISLNNEGRAQAEKLAERLRSVPVSAIYSSPLERVAETAAPLATMLKLTCNLNDGLLELDFGEWTNKTIEELIPDKQFKLFNIFRSNTRIPGGEMMLEAQARVVTALEQLRLKHQHETIAIFSHADIIKAAISYYAGIHIDLFQRIEINPASISIIEVYDDTARILLLNDTGELNAAL